jgi:hypothetical protein
LGHVGDWFFLKRLVIIQSTNTLDESEMMRQVIVFLFFEVLILGAVLSDCPHQRSGLTPWSIWARRPSLPNQNVTISSNERILLDINPPDIYLLDIYGELIFNPSVPNLTLRAYFIYIRDGGHLWVGNVDCDYTGKFVHL